MSARRLWGLKPASRAATKRCMPFMRAAMKSGVWKGYFPSAVSGSPSTRFSRPPGWSRGARARNSGAM